MAEVNKWTLGPSGGGYDYSTMSAWEAGAQGTTVAAGEQWVLQVTAFRDTSNLDFGGWSYGDATSAVVIEPATPADEYTGQFPPSSLDFEGYVIPSSGIAWRTRDNSRLTIRRMGGTSTGNNVFYNSGGNVELTWDGCFGESVGSSLPIMRLANSGGTKYVRNCIAIAAGGEGFLLPAGSEVTELDNNTVYQKNTNVAFSMVTAVTNTLRNNVGVRLDGGLVWSGAGAIGGSNNASSDTSSPGTSPQNNVVATAIWTDPANGDLRPVAAQALDDNGVNLYGTFINDAINYIRPDALDWTIGAYEVQGAPPAEPTFNGPDIVDQTGDENVLFVFDENAEGDVASRYTDATTFALSPLSDPLPTGLTVNATTGNIEGTPTVNGTFPNVIIRGAE